MRILILLLISTSLLTACSNDEYVEPDNAKQRHLIERSKLIESAHWVSVVKEDDNYIYLQQGTMTCISSLISSKPCVKHYKINKANLSQEDMQSLQDKLSNQQKDQSK